jgi:hypothetical protein
MITMSGRREERRRPSSLDEDDLWRTVMSFHSEEWAARPHGSHRYLGKLRQISERPKEFWYLLFQSFRKLNEERMASQALSWEQFPVV